MTIHVPIGEAETRLSELVAAAMRGEDVVLQRAGEPQVRLVAVSGAAEAERRRVAAKRRTAFGLYRHMVDDPDGLTVEPLMNDAELEDSYRRKFGPPA